MVKKQLIHWTVAVLTVTALGYSAHSDDWPTWGNGPGRNMVSKEKGIVTDFDAGKHTDPNTNDIDMKTTRNVRWVLTLGSSSYATPVVADGKVYVGTNNSSPHLKRFKGDRSILLCVDEKTGKVIWNLAVPKLTGGTKVGDWEYLGICSAPTIEGKRAYMVTNRCEVICLDTEGMANGNDGPFKDEGQYLSNGFDSKDPKPPVEVKPTDADIIWRVDMRSAVENPEAGELGLAVFPHNVTSSSILIVGDTLYVSTSNGVDWQHVETPSPLAPTLIALDKKTGKLLGEDDTDMSTRIFHGNWTSPTHGKVDGKDLIFFGGPDGWLYAFDTTIRQQDGYGLMNEVWRFDANPKHYREDPKTKRRIPYAQNYISPSEIIATPVFYKDRIYVQIGQDPEHLYHAGNFVCVDAKTGKPIWQFDKMHTGMPTAAVTDTRVYVSDFNGLVYCLDADTGKLIWRHDTLGEIWGSPLLVDGKLLQGNDDGVLTVFDVAAMEQLAKDKAGDKPLYSATKSGGKIGIVDEAGQKTLETLDKEASVKIITEVEIPGTVRSTPVVANGVLYLMTNYNLWAVAPK